MIKANEIYTQEPMERDLAEEEMVDLEEGKYGNICKKKWNL